jgi:hypothetical protein
MQIQINERIHPVFSGSLSPYRIGILLDFHRPAYMTDAKSRTFNVAPTHNVPVVRLW